MGIEEQTQPTSRHDANLRSQPGDAPRTWRARNPPELPQGDVQRWSMDPFRQSRRAQDSEVGLRRGIYLSDSWQDVERRISVTGSSGICPFSAFIAASNRYVVGQGDMGKKDRKTQKVPCIPRASGSNYDPENYGKRTY